jgi:hypothetical protein
MKLWILEERYDDGNSWDCAVGFVVGAENEADARKFASGQHGDEGSKYWLDPKMTSCKVLEPTEGVILRDFRAA